MLKFEWNALRVGDHVLVHNDADLTGPMTAGVVSIVDARLSRHGNVKEEPARTTSERNTDETGRIRAKSTADRRRSVCRRQLDEGATTSSPRPAETWFGVLDGDLHPESDVRRAQNRCAAPSALT
jgi:hypothetical protein